MNNDITYSQCFQPVLRLGGIRTIAYLISYPVPKTVGGSLINTASYLPNIWCKLVKPKSGRAGEKHAGRGGSFFFQPAGDLIFDTICNIRIRLKNTLPLGKTVKTKNNRS